MRHTRNLLAKTFTWQRQSRWGLTEGFGPMISLVGLKTLQSELRHRPPIELQQAAHDLGIHLSEVGLHQC